MRSDQIGRIDDGDGKLVGCGKRRIVSRIKWYPSLSVSDPPSQFLSSSPTLARSESASFSLRFSLFDSPVRLSCRERDSTDRP